MNSILIMALMVFCTLLLAGAKGLLWLLLAPLFAGRMLWLTFR